MVYKKLKKNLPANTIHTHTHTPSTWTHPVIRSFLEVWCCSSSKKCLECFLPFPSLCSAWRTSKRGSSAALSASQLDDAVAEKQFENRAVLNAASPNTDHGVGELKKSVAEQTMFDLIKKLCFFFFSVYPKKTNSRPSRWWIQHARCRQSKQDDYD